MLSASEEDALIGKDEILSGDLELLHGCRSWIKSWDNCTMSYFVREVDVLLTDFCLLLCNTGKDKSSHGNFL